MLRTLELRLGKTGCVCGRAHGFPGPVADVHDGLRLEPQLPDHQRVADGPGACVQSLHTHPAGYKCSARHGSPPRMGLPCPCAALMNDVACCRAGPVHAPGRILCMTLLASDDGVLAEALDLQGHHCLMRAGANTYGT